MTKLTKKIASGEILADIRTGMPDSELMKKYRLSATGLQDLLKQMERQGLVSIISARDFLRDIRMGMGDVDLMVKYELSAKSLGTVFEQMESAGISIDLEKSLAAGSRNKVRIDDVVKDIRSGSTKQELIEKYRLTGRSLSWVLMKLVSMGAINWQEIYGKLRSSHEELAPDKLRRSERYTPHFYVPIYTSDEPDVVGSVRDVSQHGISVKGIQAEVGETQRLVIPGDSFGELGKLIFDARCAWSRKDSRGEYLSGFEITDVDAGNKRELQLLIELSSLKTH
jgi:uncharacterized protein (DUF433 family)